MNCPKTQRPHPRSGLTLIDLSVTVLIIGVMASVVGPRMTDYVHYHRARSAAGRVVSDFLLVQRTAKSKSAEYTIRFLPVSNSYQILGMSDPDRPNRAYQVDLWDYPYQATIENVQPQTATDIVYDVHGFPSVSATILIAAGATSFSVSVDSTTGEVTVQ